MAPMYSTFGTLLGVNRAEWYAGQPTRRFWGTKMPSAKRPLAAFRCTACGLLEFYAE